MTVIGSNLNRMELDGGSQTDLRIHNEKRVLGYILEHPGCSQTDIASASRLTRAAVAQLIHRKGGVDLSHLLMLGKGKPAPIRVKDGLAAVMAVDVGLRHVRVQVRDVAEASALDTVYEGTTNSDLVDDSPAALELAVDLMAEALNDSEFSPEDLAGVAIGVPFPVDLNGLVVTDGSWRHTELPSALWDRLGWDFGARDAPPAIVESDASLGAIAELDAFLGSPWLRGLSRAEADIVYIKLSRRITAAIIIRGEVHRGHSGRATQFLHLPIEGLEADDTAICEICGQRCLDSVASLRAIVESLGNTDLAAHLNALRSEECASELVARARDGDDACSAALGRAAIALGSALGPVVNILNPPLVVVGGAINSQDFSYLAPLVQKALEKTASKVVADDVTVQAGRCTGHAAVEGGLQRARSMFAVSHLLRLPGES